MEHLIINIISREKRFALIKNGVVEKIYVEQPSQQSLVSNIYLGIVERVIPGMNAAFVNFGEEMSGFLSRDKLPGHVLSEDENKANRSISSYIHQGEKLLVQVEKDAAGTKGARLTGIIEIPGENLVYMPNGKYIAVSKKAETPEIRERWRELAKELKTEEEGLIFRTESLTQNEEVIANELEQQRSEYQKLLTLSGGMKKPGIVHSRDYFYEQASAAISLMKAGSVIVDSLEFKKKLEPLIKDEMTVSFYNGKENIFSFYKIEQEIERLLKRIVWLEKGAYMVIDHAEALTVFDVNTGKFSGKSNLRDTVIKTNMNAAVEAARQMRLRDLAGIILIDFIDMQDSKDRDMVLNVIRKELMHDDRRTRIVGFTELGILQLTRKKTKQSLAETLTETCGTCGGSGQVLSSETMAYRLERELWEYRSSDHESVSISATKEVIDHFSGEAGSHKARLEKALGMKIKLTASESDRPFYEIVKFGVHGEKI
ncbi:ribonuclease E/G [Bacillus sp. JJ1609]|uniref:ribonuclease E/G n=1 Tax=Bacillus sp. JJ1609 TaxID=3122977 RepID=UPI002FFFBC78